MILEVVWQQEFQIRRLAVFFVALGPLLAGGSLPTRAPLRGSRRADPTSSHVALWQHRPRADARDEFYAPACVTIAADAKDLVADAAEIEAYLEACYGCKGEDCYRQRAALRRHPRLPSLGANQALSGLALRGKAAR